MPRSMMSVRGAIALAAAGALAPLAAAAEEAHKAGLPQLEPRFFAPQLFWLAVSFVVLYLLMSRVALPAVGAVIDARSRRIEADLAAAQTARSQAEALSAEVEKALASARADAQATLREAAGEIARSQTSVEHEIGQRIAAQARDAESRIGAAKAEALGHVREIAVAATVAATERLIGVTPDAAEVERLIAAQVGGA